MHDTDPNMCPNSCHKGTSQHSKICNRLRQDRLLGNPVYLKQGLHMTVVTSVVFPARFLGFEVCGPISIFIAWFLGCVPTVFGLFAADFDQSLVVTH